MSSFATNVPYMTDTFTDMAADPTRNTVESASNAGTKSNATDDTGSIDEINTLNDPDVRVIQDLWGLLKDMRPDHLRDPWGTQWSSFVASLHTGCERYLKNDRPASTFVVIRFYDRNIKIALGRTGVEGRFFTCLMFLQTDSWGRLTPVGDDEDGEVNEYHRRHLVDSLNSLNSLNRKTMKTITDLSAADNLTLEHLLKEMDVNNNVSHQICVNENDSAAWRTSVTNNNFSGFIGVIDLEKEVCYEEVWYDAPEPKS